MWKKLSRMNPGWKYTIISNDYIVEMTGGSVCIKEKATDTVLKRFEGLNYVYTGDIRPDELECFALENGKHFYVYSLKKCELIKKVTLPRFYESMFVCGFYSDDGKILNIPVQRWIDESPKGKRKYSKGYYEYALCKYETEQYSLIEKELIDGLDDYWLENVHEIAKINAL